MSQDIDNQSTVNNRFIFLDDFYNNLGDSDSNNNELNQIENKEPLQFDSNVSKVDEQKLDIKDENINVENQLNEEKELNIPVITSEIKTDEQITSVENKTTEDNNIANESNQVAELNIPVITNEIKNDEQVATIENQVSEDNDIKNKSNQIGISNTLNISTEVENQKYQPEESKEYELTSKLDVETGINTALEQEILNHHAETLVKPPIVQNTNSMWDESDKKIVYKAKRNPIPNLGNIENNSQSINTDLKLENQSPKKVVPSPIGERLMQDKWQPSTPLPIIIQDGELEKIKAERIENTIKNMPIIKSDLLDELKLKENQTGKISILARYGEDFCSKDYITNPAIGRQEEIKQLILILLTPEKSAILVGKPGIGKTSIVEGLAYCLQRNNVPDALKGYRIVSVKSISLLGNLPTGETRLQTLIDELKELDKIILFIDETHMLMGATDESSVDFANMFKESLGRGSIKMIGATTNDEYERYVLRDKAFVRRFQRVDVEEPTKEQTIKILTGTLPKIEKTTGAKLKYSNYIQNEIMSFIVDITSEYKRVYGIGSRYPDICLTLLSQAFSQAVFDNRKEVNIFDIRNAIENSKNIYPDVIRKELVNFDVKFKQIINEEKAI